MMVTEQKNAAAWSSQAKHSKVIALAAAKGSSIDAKMPTQKHSVLKAKASKQDFNTIH